MSSSQPSLRRACATRFLSFAMTLLTTILLCASAAAAVLPLPKYNDGRLLPNMFNGAMLVSQDRKSVV